MNQLIKFEFRKLFKSTSFMLVTLIASLLVLISIFTEYRFSSHDEISGLLAGEFVFDFANISCIYLLIGIFMAIFTCDNYSTLTIKNIYSKGYTRGQVYFSKYIVTLCGTLIITMITYLVTIILGLVFFHSIKGLPEKYIIIFLAQLFTIVLYHSFYFFLSNSLGNVGGAVSLCIIVPFAANLLLVSIDANIDANFSLIEYWISYLSSVPFSYGVKLAEIGKTTLISIMHIIIWSSLGYLANRKKQF